MKGEFVISSPKRKDLIGYKSDVLIVPRPVDPLRAYNGYNMTIYRNAVKMQGVTQVIVTFIITPPRVCENVRVCSPQRPNGTYDYVATGDHSCSPCGRIVHRGSLFRTKVLDKNLKAKYLSRRSKIRV